MAVQQTFDSLKKQRIDPEILRVNLNYLNTQAGAQHSQREPYTDRKSLFDYIDDQAVLDLQQQTDDEISAVEVNSREGMRQFQLVLYNADLCIFRHCGLHSKEWQSRYMDQFSR